MPTASSLLGAARVVVACSALAALAAHAWLAVGHAWVPEASAAACVAGIVGGWLWRRGTQAVILALGHVWPLAWFLATGTVDALAVMVWVSAVTGLAVATSPVTQWSLPGRWQVPVAAWGVLLAVAWPIVLARELDFTLVTYVQNGTANGLWSGPVRDSTAVIVAASATMLGALVLVDWLWAIYGDRRDGRFLTDVVVPLTAGTTVALGVGIYQGTVDLSWWSAGVWPGLGRAAGTYFDSNAFGATAALWAAPVAGVAMLSRRRLWRGVGLVLIVAAAVAVWASGSRTALAGLMVVLGGIGWALGRAGRFSPVLSAAAALAVASTLAIGWTTGGPGSALHRVWQTLPALSGEGIGGFVTDMWTRNGYGSASVAMLRAYPFTGVGPGAYPVMAPGYAVALSGELIPPDNAQNWWRHQFTELGVVAGLVPLACSLLVLAAGVALVRRRERPVNIVAAGAVGAAGVMSLVSAPTSHSIVLLTLAIVIYWVSAEAARARRDAGTSPLLGDGGAVTRRGAAPIGGAAPMAGTHRRPNAGISESGSRPAGRLSGSVALVIVWGVPLIWAAATARAAVEDLRPPYRAERMGWPYAYGFSPAEALPGGGQRRWAGQRAVGVVPVTGTGLRLTLRVPEGGDGGAGPMRVRVWTRRGVVLDEAVGATPVECAIPFAPGERWRMVQIETSRPGVRVGTADHAVEVTSVLF